MHQAPPGRTVLLVNPPIDKTSGGNETEFLPLNLLALHTRLKMSGVATTLIDMRADNRSVSETIGKNDGEEIIVGIGLYKNSLQSTLDIAATCKKIAQETGKKVRVIIGGADATMFGDFYLDLYGDILDGAILGHGEDAMVDLAKGRDPKNLLTTAKKQAGIRIKPAYDTDLNEGFPYDYTDLEMQRYWQHAAKNFSTKGSRFELSELDKPLMINSQRGCYWQNGDKGTIKKCVFCCRPDKKWSGINPKMFWEKLYAAMSETGANCVSDLCYDFLGNRQWFEALMDQKPDYFKYPFKYIFAGGDSLCDEKIIHLLSEKLNLHAVLNSIEHGDERCQTAFGKVYSSAQTAASLHHLDKYRIGSRLSFVVGAPRTATFEGESEETIANFLEYIKNISGHKSIQLIVGGVLTPVAGSRIYYHMMAKGKHKAEYKLSLPFIDQKTMTRHFFEEFTNISIERAEEVRKEIVSLFPSDVVRA